MGLARCTDMTLDKSLAYAWDRMLKLTQRVRGCGRDMPPLQRVSNHTHAVRFDRVHVDVVDRLAGMYKNAVSDI
jgi:hypothetical protein